MPRYEIYMDQAEGLETSSDSVEKLVYKLNKSLYGLKQSGRNWNSLLHNHLLENNFLQSDVDHCFYIKDNDGKLVVILDATRSKLQKFEDLIFGI